MQFNKLIFLLAILLLASGCNGYQKILKSNDTELKYEKAMEFYNNGDYYKALKIFDDLVPTTRGTEKAEDVYYHYAYSQYKNGEYILAAYHFKKFVKNYPQSDKREECHYMAAYCKYLQAPEYYLDQTATKEAINDLEVFKSKYPDSEYNKQVNKYLNELKGRLERKAFHKAQLYYHMEDWRAVAYAFKIFVDKYPVSERREEALFKILSTKYKYAEKSIQEKKAKRYREVKNAYETLMTEYPDSKFKSKAKKIKEKTDKALSKLKDTAKK